MQTLFLICVLLAISLCQEWTFVKSAEKEIQGKPFDLDAMMNYTTGKPSVKFNRPPKKSLLRNLEFPLQVSISQDQQDPLRKENDKQFSTWLLLDLFQVHLNQLSQNLLSQVKELIGFTRLIGMQVEKKTS